MRLSFRLAPAAELSAPALPDYDGRPHDTAALTACYHAALDRALAAGQTAMELPTLGIEQGWPPQFAVPAALVAAESWGRAHPHACMTLTLCAPDERCYELYREFAVTEADAPPGGAVVGFFHEYGVNGWLSNWYPAVFTLEGVTYRNAEQYLMRQKALCCGDAATAQRVMENPDPKMVKLLGRAITPYDEEKWAAAREEVIYRGLLAKFGQNSGLKQILLETGDAPIAECSPNDCIWGIGLGLDNPRHRDPDQWQGQNILGKTLMRVRAALRQLPDE